MKPNGYTRRHVLGHSSAVIATGLIGAAVPARAAGLAPTHTMRGGSNNYRPGAPIVEMIGSGGFLMTGTVRRAGDGVPLSEQRIQVWAHTTEGHERDARSHGATLSLADGSFQIDMPQIVPAVGQAHAHLAYDSDAFKAVFLRPILKDWKDTSMHVDFVLEPA